MHRNSSGKQNAIYNDQYPRYKSEQTARRQSLVSACRLIAVTQTEFSSIVAASSSEIGSLIARSFEPGPFAVPAVPISALFTHQLHGIIYYVRGGMFLFFLLITVIIHRLSENEFLGPNASCLRVRRLEGLS